jgi:hypothetical protein
MDFSSFIHQCFMKIRNSAIAVFFASLPLLAQSDITSPSASLTSLQAALVKEAVEGKYSPYPSFRQREEDLFTSSNFYAVARRLQKKYETLDLFDEDGKKKCSVALDEAFSDASLSDVSWFLINRVISKKEGVRECTVFDQACNTMARMQFLGSSMLISPSGDFGTISGPDPAFGGGDFRIYCFRKNSWVTAAPVKDAVFMGARFCRDNGIVTLWKEKRDSTMGVTIAKYDASSGRMLASIDVVSEKNRPLACPLLELIHFEDSPHHDLFGFFAIDERYSLTAQQGVPNTTVVFDLDLKVKLFSSDRIHRTIKVVDDNLVAVGTWFDAKMFSLQAAGAPENDEKFELFDFTHENAIGETEGVASPVIGSVFWGGDIYFAFEVNTVCLTFNRSLQKFSRLWQENSGGTPIASVGKKIFRYSFSTRKFTGL